MKVVHDGIDVDRFRVLSDDTDLHDLCNIPPGRKIIGNVAALVGHKDLKTFLQTAAVLEKDSPDLHFVLIGEGRERDELKRMTESLGLRSKVHFLGFRKDVPELLPQFDVFLFTSETEGLGTAIIDAFACRVPVVATRAGGIPEIIENGVNGLLAPVRDAETLARLVQKTLTEPMLRERVVAAASERLKALTKEEMAAKTIAVYQEAARGSALFADSP